MPRSHREYSIFSRPSKKKKSKKYYSVKFRGPDGAYQTPMSTGLSNRIDAVRWAEEYLKKKTYTPLPRFLRICRRILEP